MALRTFPIAVPIDASPVLLCGGGEAMLRKARLLAPFGARLRVVAPNPLPELADLAASVDRRAFTPDDLNGVALAFADGDDDATAVAVSRAAQALGIAVNVPDRPELSSFVMPAIIDRNPITVAISSGGASPVLVRRLRERLEAVLEPELGRLARLLDLFRSTVKATRHGEIARRRFWEAAIDSSPAASRLFAGDETGARAAMVQAVNDLSFGQDQVGRVALVGAGPGDPDLLTLRALRVMQDADVVVHDKLVDERIMTYVRRDARRIFVGKTKGNHALAQDDINALLIAEARAGHRVVRLKGGDPFVFGRGGEEVLALRAADVAVEVVPGITAAIGCGAASTVPLTHRGMAQGVTLITGHGKDGEPDLDWQALARLRHTLVIYMGLSSLPMVSERLTTAGLAADTPAALIENGTRPDQKLAVGTLGELSNMGADHRMTGPTLIVVGEVVRLADPARITEIALPALQAAAE